MKVILTKHKTLNEGDYEILHDMIEKRGTDNVLQTLNEWSYNDTVFTSRRTGGAELKRWDGVKKTLPGLVLTTIICWPLTLFMGVGIIGSRIKQAWEDKKHWWQKLLDPGYWGEYYKLRNEDKEGGPLWRHPVIVNKKGEKKEVELKDGKIIDKETGEEYKYDDVTMPDDIAKNEMHDFWFTLSNGEILRVASDSEANAKKLADYIVRIIAPVYEGHNLKLSQGGKCFEIYFSDGEYAYWVAQDKEIAKKEALDARKELNEKYYEFGGDHYSNLTVTNIVAKSGVKKVEAPVAGQYSNITTHEPKFNTERNKFDATKDLVYKFGNFKAYRVSVGGSFFNFPGKHHEDVANIMKRFIVNGETYKKACKGANNSKCNPYDVKIADDDSYLIFAPTQMDAKELASKIHHEKIEYILKMMDNREREEFHDRMEEYKDDVTKFKKEHVVSPKKIVGRTFVFPTSFTVTRMETRTKEEREASASYKI